VAFNHGKQGAVYVGGYDLTSYITDADTAHSRDMAQTTTLGLGHHTFVPGQASAVLTLEGLFDGATGAVWEILSTLKNAATQGTAQHFPAGDTAGELVDNIYGYESSINPAIDAGDAVQLSAEFTSNVAAETGERTHGLEARTSSGTSTILDQLNPSTNGWAAYLVVTDVSGALPTLDVEIHDSNDNFAADDTLLTGAAFTQVTSANQSQRLAVLTAGTSVKRYIRADYTIGGTTPSFKFHVNFVRF
jgi:hypothetical protein